MFANTLLNSATYLPNENPSNINDSFYAEKNLNRIPIRLINLFRLFFSDHPEIFDIHSIIERFVKLQNFAFQAHFTVISFHVLEIFHSLIPNPIFSSDDCIIILRILSKDLFIPTENEYPDELEKYIIIMNDLCLKDERFIIEICDNIISKEKLFNILSDNDNFICHSEICKLWITFLNSSLCNMFLPCINWDIYKQMLDCYQRFDKVWKAVKSFNVFCKFCDIAFQKNNNFIVIAIEKGVFDNIISYLSLSFKTKTYAMHTIAKAMQINFDAMIQIIEQNDLINEFINYFDSQVIDDFCLEALCIIINYYVAHEIQIPDSFYKEEFIGFLQNNIENPKVMFLLDII